jgi:CRISPR type I-E-associated protein CasB/Cse2
MNNLNPKNPFIKYLYSLVDAEKRGALADLRRGLSGQPGTIPVMFQYIVPWVPDSTRNSWNEKVYYIIASLFAYYQAGGSGKFLSSEKGNFGEHCRRLNDKKAQSASFEARFTGLLKAHRDDIPTLIKQVLSVLRGEEIPINWDQLFHDLQYWNSSSQIVQRQWANGYWKYQEKDQAEQADQKEKEKE